MLEAPPIGPVKGNAARPLWSVMIPAYNCGHYLKEALTSVLSQAPKPEMMQIEVVDDCSIEDDIEGIVKQIGKGRINFYRQATNQGAIRNFNTCIERARGHLVHILHADDSVLPDFYKHLQNHAGANPLLSLFAVRAFFVDQTGAVKSASPRIPELESGSHCASSLYYSNPLRTPAVVLRRSFYEQHGGFLPRLVHTADCEMWSRAIALGGGLVSPEILACYRSFPDNDTGRLARTAENLRDLQRFNAVLAQRAPDFDPHRARKSVKTIAVKQTRYFRASNDRSAYEANRRFLNENSCWYWRIINGWVH
jgi:glycosyltransferase involved in cell wall biosynthesis